MELSRIFTKENLIPGFSFVALLLVVSVVHSLFFWRVDTDCSIDNYVADASEAWINHTNVKKLDCYNEIFAKEGSMQFSRKYSREIEAVIAEGRPRAAYKIGMHMPELIEMMGADGPMWGVLYGEDALLESYDEVPIYEDTPVNWEPDFLVRISGEGIMEAKTMEEVGQYIDRVYAFIEFPELGRPIEDWFVDIHTIQALNLGARYGVLGEYMDTDSDPNFIENLRNMTVVMSDHTGATRFTYNVNTESIHFYESMFYAIDLMKERGETLKAGDLVSIGALLPMEAFGWTPNADSKTRHVHYFIGERVLHVAANFKQGN